MATMDEQFVEFIVKALVSKPDSVEINRTIDEKGVLLELTVDQEDLGRVIGKRGNTAQSIRTLLRALGTKNDARYNLKIVDPEGDKRREERDSAPKKSHKRDDDSSKEEADVAITPSDNGSSSNQWAHLSSSNDTSSDNDDIADTSDDESSTESTEQEDDVVAKTKKELADLDDLDL